MLESSAPRPDRPGVAVVVTRNLILASEVLLIFGVAAFFHKAPEFVYKAF
jgi:hypothetical protein